MLELTTVIPILNLNVKKLKAKARAGAKLTWNQSPKPE